MFKYVFLRQQYVDRLDFPNVQLHILTLMT